MSHRKPLIVKCQENLGCQSGRFAGSPYCYQHTWSRINGNAQMWGLEGIPQEVVAKFKSEKCTECSRKRKGGLLCVVCASQSAPERFKKRTAQNREYDPESSTAEELEKLGFSTLRSGWPDILVSDGVVTFAVEVKRGSDFVRDNQQQVHTILQSAGVPVLVSRELDDIRPFVAQIRAGTWTQIELFDRI